MRILLEKFEGSSIEVREKIRQGYTALHYILIGKIPV
jgi:hypothetical protein